MLTDNGPTDDDLAAYTDDRDSPVTAHPIDTEALREHLRRLIDASAGPGNPTVSIDDLRALLDALAAAEHRATRAEARGAIRKKQVAYWRAETQRTRDRLRALDGDA